MKEYEVFASEGGFRYAGQICNGNPVMDASPWFETREKAESAAAKKAAATKKATDEYMGINGIVL